MKSNSAFFRLRSSDFGLLYHLYQPLMIETSQAPERAILIGIIYPGQDEREVDDFLDELSFLTETAGAEPVKR